MNELMMCLAVATANLDSSNFQTRLKAEDALMQCGIFAGAHIESAKKSKSAEVRKRADNVWLHMPNFFARFRVINTNAICAFDFHLAALNRNNDKFPADEMTRIFEETADLRQVRKNFPRLMIKRRGCCGEEYEEYFEYNCNPFYYRGIRDK